MERIGTDETRGQLRRVALWVVGLFWLIQFLELTIIGLAEGRAYALRELPERALIVTTGIVLSTVLVETAGRVEHWRFRERLLAIVTAALMLCVVLVCATYGIAQLGIGGRHPFDLVGFVYIGFTWSWFFLSLAAAILALSYSLEVRDREHRLAELEIEAQDARLAALRYQLNPHFLFNTLNSIAALVGRADQGAAERMVENLSDFLRATLELEPTTDVTLAREIELQALYLAIEEVRFPERLATRYDVPDELRKARVPALISQPLIENAIRHSVARSLERVTVTIAARRVGERLQLVVEDDGRPAAPRQASGTGVGIANVRARLAARFGKAQSLLSAPLPGGGYRSTIEIPWSTLA